MLYHALGGAVILFSLQHLIAPVFILLPCLQARGTRDCNEGRKFKEGSKVNLQVLLENLQFLLEINILLLVGKHEVFDII